MARPYELRESRNPIAARLAGARTLTDRLFGLVRPEALLERPIPERHRLIFYLGHLEAFDRNLLARGGPCPELDRLFAFGIDPVDGELPHEPASAWPREPEVRAYCAATRSAIDQCLSTSDIEERGKEGNELLNMAIEHRLMHAETLAYALHRLPLELKLAQLEPMPSRMAWSGPSMSEVPSGVATLGLPRDGRFGWDNEFEAHQVEVPGFRIGAFKVTNGEFLDFVHAGGYETASLWDPGNWEWLRRSGRGHPSFWRLDHSGWVFRGMFRERPLAMEEPVWLSQAEASAYAAWKGMRLPTEAEWHRAACGAPDGSEREYPWGNEPPTIAHGNFDSYRWDPTPVGSHPEGRSAFGAYDLLGNGWEWTSTPFAPFAGFKANGQYPGYSADFFDGRHFVLKGGSPRTDAVLLRRSFRNWFQPHYPYLYAGFRLVQP
ncbi:MAG TPA: SUMF1/EgtB/PvdO family nonheme iron enzyme [Candidatus Polarisedimenticolia bacterium]|nr:SUMF1/EgtB/PvdO family nonheme iron enzyme [Candidatus Polarisedimenticolia bacterium]